jgi:tol-pal system protein YbgF
MMRVHNHRIGRLLSSVFLALLSTLAVPVVLAQEAAGAAAAPVSDQRLSELFYQLQVLQQEVQELRGLVEEQSYQLNRLARDQKEQYIDLDRRVAGLTTGTGVAAASGAGQPAGSSPGTAGAYTGAGSAGAESSSSGALTAPATGAVAALPGAASGVSEREAYEQAFDLMKGRKFDESIAAFDSLIVGYPNGQYTPNAFYWLGELYLAQQNTEQARQSFMQVINLYPDHPKVPDTLYKLGVAYHRLGDTTRALEYFSQVQSRYPQSSAAGLAASYQQELR